MDGQNEQTLHRELERLQSIIESLDRSSKLRPENDASGAEATLKQYTHEFITSKMQEYRSSPWAHNTKISPSMSTPREGQVASWLEALNAIRQDQQDPAPSPASPSHSIQGKHTIMTRSTSNQSVTADAKPGENDSDDDLDTDLAKAALDTGKQAFDAQKWQESHTLLQESLRLLLRLPKPQRGFCDNPDLHYRLAVCGYHTQDALEAEKGLTSLIEVAATSEDQRRNRLHAMHLLAQLFIHADQVDRARVECEKALQGRRKLSGKKSPAALESTALMAHIYVLLDNRALAKSYLAMIPETERFGVLESVERDLGSKVEHLDFSSLLHGAAGDDTESLTLNEHRRLSSVSGHSSPPAEREQGKHLGSPLGLYREDSNYSADVTTPGTSATSSQSPATSASNPSQWSLPYRDAGHQKLLPHHPPPSINVIHPPNPPHPAAPLIRAQILTNLNIHPRDKIESAICTPNTALLPSLLQKRSSFWRASLRNTRSERVTALHFAALFGDTDSARLLLAAGYNVNEVPFGYSTALTPLHFAIGARQVGMVEWLLANKARPCEGETWAGLAGQAMSRAWIVKTVGEGDREGVAERVVAVFGMLRGYGWDVNEGSGANGGTVLHQAVGFWTGSYAWDLGMRVVVSKGLCGMGADPWKANKEGKSAWDLALAEGHKDVLLVLEECARVRERGGVAVELAELPGQT